MVGFRAQVGIYFPFNFGNISYFLASSFATEKSSGILILDSVLKLFFHSGEFFFKSSPEDILFTDFRERGKKGERETKRGRHTERNRETETLGVTLQAAELPGQGCALGGFQIFFFSILKFQNDIP